ncbi:hypothetical protein ACIP5Y_26010 [Nocardia sp. NPDC088792]|uniref:hypothetical protein n=1 Tax=Nocardia sp. NPDC088792 TaxID=3364332 RepID=UPI0037FDCB58
MTAIDTVFLNGTVGVGKSTVAEAIAGLEEAAHTPHAVIDLDFIRQYWPAPAHDPFNLELELANLAAMAANYRAAGAKRLILAGVIERPHDVSRYVEATNADGLMVARLTLDPAQAEERLRRRHAGDPEGLAWHLARFGELSAVLDAAALDDVVVDTSGLSPVDVARQVRRAAGWL